jgi:hypothetical protein
MIGEVSQPLCLAGFGSPEGHREQVLLAFEGKIYRNEGETEESCFEFEQAAY